MKALICTRTEKCVSCKGEHTSFSRNCFTWKQEKEIISTKIKKQISYQEARKLVKSQTPTSGNSYASVANKSTSTPSADRNKDISTVSVSKPSDSTTRASPITNLLISSTPSVAPVSEEALASPDFTDFKPVTNAKKLKKNSPTKTNNTIAKAEKISRSYTTSHREVPNSIPTKDNISTHQSAFKPFETTKPTSVDTELLPMAVLPPLEKALVQSRESDADAEMSSSSLSEEDALEYDMSEDLEDSPAVTSRHLTTIHIYVARPKNQRVDSQVQETSYPEAKKLVQSRTPIPGISYASSSKATKKSSNLTLPFDTSSESDHINKPDSMTVEFLPVTYPETLSSHASALISESASGDPRTPTSPDFETVIKENKHKESKPKMGIPDTDSFKDFPSKPVSTPCDSPDLSGFITVKKKKKRKNKSTSIKEKNNGNTADQQSKFWTTSPLHISNADSMQVDESASSVQVNTTTIFDNSIKSPSAILNSEAIPIVSSENEDAIDYDPHETIEDMPPVIEQQQQQTSIDATSPETAALKRQSKKCHFRLVDFKTFHNEPLSTPVHDNKLGKDWQEGNHRCSPLFFEYKKGVISESEFQNDTEADITEYLNYQNVSAVKRISIRKDGQYVPNKHLILAFNVPNFPKSVLIAYINCPVRPYVPDPLRCYKCQKFGHSVQSYRGNQTCARCAEIGHASNTYEAAPLCANCKGDHLYYARLCPHWKDEKEIQAVQVKQNVSLEKHAKLSQTEFQKLEYLMPLNSNLLYMYMWTDDIFCQ
ncbi:hypothetical protein AVEN_79319-1 [Araneus ventricosus]|uniref:Nucleic-acid-binding protein from transposon X-element n=1 Tax=Araneus ventricosus TaxID=182803 RepID=A0A4Y2JYQ8_ARAVE|nr:hypothetical protein AVEN_79319-1 [Araneus ventricosus]